MTSNRLPAQPAQIVRGDRFRPGQFPSVMFLFFVNRSLANQQTEADVSLCEHIAQRFEERYAIVGKLTLDHANFLHDQLQLAGTGLLDRFDKQ